MSTMLRLHVKMVKCHYIATTAISSNVSIPIVSVQTSVINALYISPTETTSSWAHIVGLVQVNITRGQHVNSC